MPQPDSRFVTARIFGNGETVSGDSEDVSVRATIVDCEQRLQSRFDLVDSRLEKLMREIDSFQAAGLRPEVDTVSRPYFSSEAKFMDISGCLTLNSADSGRFKKAALKHIFRPSREGRYWSGSSTNANAFPLTALQRQPLHENRVVTGGHESGAKGESKQESTNGWSLASSISKVSATLLNSPSRVSRSPQKNPDCWERLIEHYFFDPVCAFVVILNSLLVGVQINHDAIYDHEELAYRVIEYVCAAFFTIELFIRISARKRNFCSRGEARWASFDLLLVVLSWVDVVLELTSPDSGGVYGPGASLGKAVRLARMARILRILRMIRWLTRIRVMATLIIGSMVSLFWLLILLFTILYIFAIVLTQGATMWLKPGTEDMVPTADPDYDDVKYYYGSVPKTIYTLFMSMTGGVNWGIPGGFSKSYGLGYFIVFISYVFFAIFSVMNIVTGVFVDGAIQQADLDRSVMMKKDREQRLELSKQLEEVLTKLDVDEDGFLSRVEWVEIFTDPAIRAVFSSIQIDINEAEDLYDLLDVDGDGQVSITEFIDGMFRLKGWAKAIDVERLNARATHLLKINKKMYKMMEFLFHASGR